MKYETVLDLAKLDLAEILHVLLFNIHYVCTMEGFNKVNKV